jgi:GTP diphosphokinase / guanosine-3',5'-bis(diphosphate) 3'-diphosphatase
MPKSQPPQTTSKIKPVSEIVRFMNDASAEDVTLVRNAYAYASDAHQDHLRHSGEPYMVHLAETALILATIGAGAVTIAAGLLHDTVEDTSIAQEEIAFLVEGVTKLGKLKYQGTDRHNESLRKLFVAMSEDIRVLLIKLADRLHNMRTLAHVPEDKRARIAAETLEIYAPIAYRLGIRKINRELEDLAFPYVYPEAYGEMSRMLSERHEDRTGSMEKFSRSVKKTLAKEGIVHARTEYRVKGLYSLYKKWLRNEKDIEKIYDINAMRILLETEPECYSVLGIIHARWRPLPRRIKDYIAFPKTNGYQGLHTTVFIGDGSIVEVQIKTRDMHRHSEYGIASHVAYKSRGNKDALAWVHALLPKVEAGAGDKHKSRGDVPSWIKELAEYEEPSKDHKNFREGLKSDFFNHRIFVFSPRGDVVDLPLDSTPIDFAYSIHSDIGDHTKGAKVNGKLVALDTKLKNGDIVEIQTSESAKPSRKWLSAAKTSLARRRIKSSLS